MTKREENQRRGMEEKKIEKVKWEKREQRERKIEARKKVKISAKCKTVPW